MSKNGMYRGDAVNDYSTAHETTPESAGQEPAAWMHKQGDFLEPSLRRLDSYELSRGWTQEPLFYAAPIGDNGAKHWRDMPHNIAILAVERGDPVECDGTFACPICGKSEPHEHSSADVAKYRSQPAESKQATEVLANLRVALINEATERYRLEGLLSESKRVELTDEEIGHLRLSVSQNETISSIERGSYADDALRALRLFLARASATDIEALANELRSAMYGPASWADTTLMSRSIDALHSQAERIQALEAKCALLAASLDQADQDTKRLDFLLAHDAFAVRYDRGGPNPQYRRFFATEREAIDAAIAAQAGSKEGE